MGQPRLKDIPYGYCHCGCGNPAPLAKYADALMGYVAGQPKRFIHGHHVKWDRNPKWMGGKVTLGARTKYVGIRLADHPKCEAGGYVREHILVAEKILGKYLPVSAVVHHVDGNGYNNSPRNLVVCQDELYHKLLHKRSRAYMACGHAHWLKCKFCKQYDNPENLHLVKSRNGGAGYHQLCQHEYDKKRRGEHGKFDSAGNGKIYALR